MAALFTDNFNRANGTLGANWTNLGAGACSVVSNQCAMGNGSDALPYWNGGTPNADCYVQCLNVTQGYDLYHYSGLVLRFSSTTYNGYGLIWDTGRGAQILRFDGGVPTLLGSAFTQPSNGQVVKLEIVGSTISVYYNSSLQTTRTDSTYSAAARAGILGLSVGVIIDDFECGNYDAPGGGTLPPFIHHFKMQGIM